MFVQGHGQKSEQKHRTKNFAKFPNHLPLLTMITFKLESDVLKWKQTKWIRNENSQA